MMKASTFSSSHFRPTPSCGLSHIRRPQMFPRPQGGGMSGRDERFAKNDLRAYTANRTSKQTGNGPASHYRSTESYSHRPATSTSLMRRKTGIGRNAPFLSAQLPHILNAPRRPTPTTTTWNENTKPAPFLRDGAAGRGRDDARAGTI